MDSAPDGRGALARSLDLPRVIGHRGAAASAPENTLAGLRRAAALGVRWVEFDVKLTACGQPVLMHDDTLERTTNGFGRVAETTLEELRRLDAGSWFDPAFAGERVPTFAEALALAGELGLGVNVEIKPCPGREAETARVATEALATLWPSDRPTPLVSSFAPECLAVAREVAPELPRGLLCHRLPRTWRELMERFGCRTLHVDQLFLSARRVAEVKAEGVPLLAYTVNRAGRARRLFAWGLDAVFTDAPEVVAPEA